MGEPDQGVRDQDDLPRLRVESWRAGCLYEAGCARITAKRLALTGVDLHTMVSAKRHGATDEQMREIFL